MLEIADIFRRHGKAYVDRYGKTMLPSHIHAFHSILKCRTAAWEAMYITVISVAGIDMSIIPASTRRVRNAVVIDRTNGSLHVAAKSFRFAISI